MNSAENTGLAGKVVFISGGSRGIGKAIALRAAADGARVVIAAKTVDPHPKLPGTIHETAEEVRAAGGEALPVQMDIREDDLVDAAVARAVEEFGQIDLLVNNASAISLTPVSATPMKRVDLMWDVNVRGTYTLTRAAVAAMKEGGHIVNLSPPMSMNPVWFARHTAYTISKYGMSMCVLGMSEEFRGAGIAVNALWPKTVIDTEALRMIPGVDRRATRKPQIMADAWHALVQQDPKQVTGQFLLDEEILARVGITDLQPYASDPEVKPMPDLFVEGPGSLFDPQ
ncbi:short chain dehydrogenase [bacterium TMED181]|nr:short chain dehydrogenase [Planctomycetota bacterium]OUW47243.1 MAG: short chain dehydrogenase [bacterium TMED181]